ncbi:hypothetical protein CP533_3048 [Ophiocordyceps camponoti-saundersi (nom. inval.)]|nr:hypothetical protein CP533_3048 [Ophiocordyceps camponoti-saundersi (nom. inval.)]
MTTGIISGRYSVRSSPYASLFLCPSCLARVPSFPPLQRNMFSRAKDQAPAAKQQSRGALIKQLFPSSSPGAPGGDLRDQFRKMNSAAAERSAGTAQPPPTASANAARPAKPGPLHSLYGNSDSFKPLTESAANAGVAPAVDFGEDDFSDDENLDLDYQAPQALPSLAPAARQGMAPPASSAHSETGIPWTSSPPAHFLPPKAATQQSSHALPSLKRDSSGDNDDLELSLKKMAKKRVLPANFRRTEPEVVEMPRGDVGASKTAAFWDSLPDAADKPKKLSKGQRDQLISDVRGLVEEQTPTPAKAVPITLSSEQLHVLDLVVNKGKSVFFTGPAGTGKSVLMKAIIRKLKEKYRRDPERVAVTASTGLAACNIGGITLHSFSGIGLGKEDASVLVKKIKRNPKARKRWEKTKVLIIDEVSMVDGALFDKLSQIGRTMRNNGRPWGGIQLVITGDFFQLPPVPDRDNQEATQFSFDAATWSTSIDHTIGLTQVFRQRDPQFASMLNELRLGKISPETEAAFQKLSRPLNFDDGVDSAQLYPTRAQVESSNEARLRSLPGQVHRYEAIDAGDPALKEKLLSNMMAPKSLELKIDSQVMLIKNLDDTLVNGSLGKVIAFSDENTFEMKTASPYDDEMEDEMAKARRKLSSFSHDGGGAAPARDGRKYPVVRFISTGGKPRVILCQPEEWKVELPNGEVQAKRNQLPLILAWALSIHKAQGQTLERVTVDLGRVFENGQAYVALSRATTQDGLRVLGFKKSKVMAHQRVIEFYGKLYSAEQAINGQSASSAKPSRILEPRAVTMPQTGRTSEEAIHLDDEEAMASWGMANQFIGLQMSVVLKDPPGYRLIGVVRDVEAGSSLSLTNVYIPSTQERMPKLTITASNISDLSEVTRDRPSPAAPPPTFVDPAILSVGRRPASNTPSSHPERPKAEREAPAEDRRPEQDLLDSIKGPPRESSSRNARATPVQKKKARVRNVKEAKVDDGSPVPIVQNSHGKGWRQTPILENTSFQPFHSLKRQPRGGKDNGWASEDVTEEMGEFDFANNLAKFDKRTIFDQMRKEDQTDDADRLVSHNRRVAKPGTAGGKNLHYSENVLDMPPSTAVPNADFWNSEADVGVKDDARLSGRETKNGHGGGAGGGGGGGGGGIGGRRVPEKKTGPSRRSQSRKAPGGGGGGISGGHPLSRVNSTVRDITPFPRKKRRGGKTKTDSRGQQQAQQPQPGLYLVPSNRRLEAISTLQMLNLENIAANELGFTEALMAENAGRGIAEVAVTALDDPAIKVRFELASSSSGSSTIVVLAGNNKSGIRALAAGRHLRNKNMDVIVCLVGIERERDLLEDVRRQIQLYRSFGGKVVGKNDLFQHLREPSGAPVTVSLIVDALLGLTMSFEELRIGDQATVYELMEWANRNEAFVLAVDVPTGIDPSTGAVAVIDGSRLYVKPRYVVAVGAPKRGLLEALAPFSLQQPALDGDGHDEDQWRLFVADMGLGSAVWRKAGAKVRRGIDFDGRWVLEMRYSGGDDEVGDE